MDDKLDNIPLVFSDGPDYSYFVFSLPDRRDPSDDVPPGGILCEDEIHHLSSLEAVEHGRVLEQEIH